jgi:hypothetical protein
VGGAARARLAFHLSPFVGEVGAKRRVRGGQYARAARSSDHILNIPFNLLFYHH